MVKNYLSLLIVLNIVGITSLAYSQELQSNSVKPGKLMFEEKLHDFGIIEFEGNGTYEFVFKNIDTCAVTLVNVRSSCGCTIPTWPHEPILPGKEASIQVKYDTKRIGAFLKTITVYANADGSPFILQIKGTVRPKEEN